MAEKRILILSRKDDRENYDQQRNLLQGLASTEGAIYSGAEYENLLFTFDGTTLKIVDTVTGVDIANFDAIFLIGWSKTKALDDIARAVAHYAKAHGVPFSNSEVYDGRSFTKLSQCVMAALSGVKVTPFMFCLDQTKLVEVVLNGDWPRPYIAKAVAASRGQDNFLITDHQQLADAVNETVEKPRYFIVQEFVPNDGDYRILVGGGKVRLAIHRQAQAGSHVNNTSQGGTATLVDVAELPNSLVEDSIRLSKLFKRELTGVDMIQHKDTGEFYFLEINNMPQLATGSFVPEKLAMLNDYLLELSSPADV